MDMFFQPRNLDDALALRAEHGPDVLTLGGGTDLLVLVNRGVLRPAGWLDLSRVAGFAGIAEDGGEIVLSGGATFSQIGALPVRALAAAA
ncbi:MAG: FAD binding domain-containing protein, partial [Phycisphaerae bacterium]